MPSSAGAADASTTGAPRDHAVTFYESDAFLVHSVVEFLLPALEAGQPGVAIATRAHLDGVEAALAARGLTEHFIGVDGDELVGRLVVGGRLDPERFRAAANEMLDRCAAEGARPRLFGEMVSILWERGDVASAIALEEEWNRLAEEREFTLFCAYPMRAFDRESDTDAFRRICDEHSSVVPSETFSGLADAADQRRLVALLQQEANAGVTERIALRQKQAELEDALARLRELDRLRGEFVAMVVHDIRSPAGVVSGYLELLNEHWSELGGDEVRRFLSSAIENTARIERLVDDILTMSRIDSGEFSVRLRPVDIGRLVDATVSQVRDQTGREIRVDRGEGPRTALADEHRQIQVLSNLLSNAVKFSPAGAPITVSVEDGTDRLLVRVRDEGPGIAGPDLERLFRPFSRLEARDGDGHATGTGLGLYIAKALVEKQGGEIWIESEPGHGSTVCYTLLPAT